MLKYIIKRILFFVPTIFAISILTFIIMSNAPGDPAELMLNRSIGGDGGQAADKLAGEKAYSMVRKRLGLDLPLFYFSFSSMASTDTLHRILKADHRKTLARLIHDYGNWKEIEAYYHAIRQLELAVLDIPKDTAVTTSLIVIRNAINNLYLNYNDKAIHASFTEIKNHIQKNNKLAVVSDYVDKMISAYHTMQANATVWKNYIPVIHLHGTQNQYHRWLFGDAPWFGESDNEYLSKGFIRGDFGISYFAKRPVGTLIWECIGYTMSISLISILITYLVSIPLGVFSAVNKGSTADQTISTTLFVLYSIPSFWLGTMLINFLCGGDFLNWFPPTGVADVDEDDSFFVWLGTQAYHLILPIFCWTYGSFAYLSRQMRGGMLAVLQQDYIRTARSKGLSNQKVVWKHAFRNSLLPVITIFSSVFPAMIGGSIVLEQIFTIPGMGKLGFEAVLRRDYPVVLTVTMFSSILTLVGYLVSDILYAIADPRISYTRNK